MLDLEASQKRDMLNLHTRFLQRLQDNRETRRNICLGLQQVFLYAPRPQYLCACSCSDCLLLCSCIKERVQQSVSGLPLHFVMDLGLQGGFACDIIPVENLECMALQLCHGHAHRGLTR